MSRLPERQHDFLHDAFPKLTILNIRTATDTVMIVTVFYDVSLDFTNYDESPLYFPLAN